VNPQDSPDDLFELCEIFMNEVCEIQNKIKQISSEASVVHQFKVNQQAIREDFIKMIQAK